MKILAFLFLTFFFSLSEAQVLAREANFSDLVNLIREKKIQNINQLFANFSVNPIFTSLLDNPVLNERSFALHREDVSSAFPRIVLHNSNLLMMTVGDPKKESSEILEIIEYLPFENRFTFELINFVATDPSEQIIQNAEDFTFSKLKHPSYQSVFKCSVCHQLSGTESIPRWGTGPLWQTPFGQVDNKIFVGSKQFLDWNKFKKTLSHPVLGKRYRLLRLGARKTEADGSLSFVESPNLALAKTIQKMNLGRVGRIVLESARYSVLDRAIVGAFLDCSNFESFFTTPAWEKLVLRYEASLEDRPYFAFEKSLFDKNSLEKLFSMKRSTEGSTVLVSEKEFLTLGGLPPLKAIEESIKSVNATSLRALLTAHLDPRMDLTGFTKAGVSYAELSDKELIDQLSDFDVASRKLLSKLRLLLEDSLAQKPILWSTAVPFADARSFQFGEGELDLRNVLPLFIGGRFFLDHPDHEKYFSEPILDLDHLRISKENYCKILREESLLNPIF